MGGVEEVGEEGEKELGRRRAGGGLGGEKEDDWEKGMGRSSANRWKRKWERRWGRRWEAGWEGWGSRWGRRWGRR